MWNFKEHLRTTASVCTQKYLQNSCQTSKMEVLTKIIDGWKSLSIFGKIFITMSINQSVSANDYWPWNWTEYGGFPSNPVSWNMVVCPSDTEASKYPYNYMSPIFSVFAFVLLYFFFILESNIQTHTTFTHSKSTKKHYKKEWNMFKVNN